MPLNQKDILKAFISLGEFIKSDTPELVEKKDLARIHNSWFTLDNIDLSLKSIAANYLDDDKLRRHLASYKKDVKPEDIGDPLVVGIVAAGNVPMVAFHDILSVLASGNILLLKISSKDDVLLPFLLEKLIEFEPALNERILLTDRLKDFDAVIATGNNNSARYFEFYFGKVPNVIRKNRNSVAILTGDETTEDLVLLGNDVFNYFGLGCRSVSKLYVPENYQFDDMIEAFKPFAHLMDHNQYRNNLDYNRTLLLMNAIPYLNVDFVNLTQNPSIASPIANLHYEYYTPDDKGREELAKLLLFSKHQIQCIVGNTPECTIKFGKTQMPELGDYADEVDTFRFLRNLRN